MYVYIHIYIYIYVEALCKLNSYARKTWGLQLKLQASE